MSEPKKTAATVTAKPKARVLALYLPQFHPLPENDEWWGKGFTEWTNVAKAKQLYPGHKQPRIPGELGFYDLRVPEVREAQAEMAREAGVEAFCYWHYWFGNGRRLLERPFNEVVKSGEPNFPFCLAWANQTWKGVWHGTPNKTLIEQLYPGVKDYEAHFRAVLPAFEDARYVRCNGKPVFMVYRPREMPDISQFIDLWQKLAKEAGLGGIHFVAQFFTHELALFDYQKAGFDAAMIESPMKVLSMGPRAIHLRRKQLRDGTPQAKENLTTLAGAAMTRLMKNLGKVRGLPPNLYTYEDASMFFMDGCDPESGLYPCIIPGWDNSPRAGKRAVILHGSTPQLFEKHVKEVMKVVAGREAENRFVFLKSWNEWAEGNYMEPDLEYGRAYLEVLAKHLK